MKKKEKKGASKLIKFVILLQSSKAMYTGQSYIDLSKKCDPWRALKSGKAQIIQVKKIYQPIVLEKSVNWFDGKMERRKMVSRICYFTVTR